MTGALYMRLWRALHPEWKENHRKLQATYRKRNPETGRSRSRARRSNLDKRIADSRVKSNWYKAHKSLTVSRVRAWRESNPKGYKDQKSRRRASKRGAICTLTVDEWSALKESYGHKCAYCDSESRLTQDHVVPLSRGGNHTMDNVVPACRPCNASKGTKLLCEWLKP